METGAKEMPVYKPDMAIVDPVLTYSLPAGSTAATGMDVLAHCVEALTNRNYNPYGYIFGKEGIKLTMKWLPVAVKGTRKMPRRVSRCLCGESWRYGDLGMRLSDRPQLQSNLWCKASYSPWSGMCMGPAGRDDVHGKIW